MSRLNDRAMHWFPRNCVNDHAIKLFAECGAIAALR